jgi:hypothetical protein
VDTPTSTVLQSIVPCLAPSSPRSPQRTDALFGPGDSGPLRAFIRTSPARVMQTRHQGRCQDLRDKVRGASVEAAPPAALPPEMVAFFVLLAEPCSLVSLEEQVLALARTLSEQNAPSKDLVAAINALNSLSADGDHEILLEVVPELLDSLADALDRCNPLGSRLETRLTNLRQEMEGKVRPCALQARMFAPPAPAGCDSPDVSGFDDPTVLGLMTVLRNLSSLVANEDAIAFHGRSLVHVVSLLPCWRGELGECAVEVVTMAAKHLDVGGMSPPEDDANVADSSLRALMPAKLRAQSVAQGQNPLSEQLTSLILHIFPTLIELLGEACDVGHALGIPSVI